MAPRIAVQPGIETVHSILSSSSKSANPPNLVPLCATIDSDFQTPSSIYLRVSSGSRSKLSFLLESAATTETIGRWSFIGAGRMPSNTLPPSEPDRLADPRHVLKTGPGHGEATDPMPLLQQELAKSRVATVPELNLPPLTGGAIGYVGYDCVKYFEPRTERPLKDILHLPESFFMFFDTVIAFDHFFQSIKIITYIKVPQNLDDLDKAYKVGVFTIRKLSNIIKSKAPVPLPVQGPIKRNQPFTSNIGQKGYESHVEKLKRNIYEGDIIQAVPSHRIARPTSLHPFNIYRHLRTVNPSPYLFYVDCDDFQLVGASPELLVKSEAGRIITHPIAGTVKRGRTSQEDEALAEQLRQSLKDRAEHVMLVDLARNDVNRVCDPLTTRVERLMEVQKFSHVQHLVSVVSGVLRPDKDRYDAFRSIFPAGTTSGAPKVRAMELIGELEKEKRGVYAGAVGYFGYGSVNEDGEEVEGAMDTCIALRTMVTKDGVAYLQAGGGIVYDSDPTEEWEETMNKLGANIRCIESAELKHLEEEEEQEGRALVDGGRNGANGVGSGGGNAHVDLAAG